MEDGKSIIWQIQKEILGSPPLNIADNPLAKLEGDEQREEAMDGRNVFFNNIKIVNLQSKLYYNTAISINFQSKKYTLQHKQGRQRQISL